MVKQPLSLLYDPMLTSLGMLNRDYIKGGVDFSQKYCISAPNQPQRILKVANEFACIIAQNGAATSSIYVYNTIFVR